MYQEIHKDQLIFLFWPLAFLRKSRKSCHMQLDLPLNNFLNKCGCCLSDIYYVFFLVNRRQWIPIIVFYVSGVGKSSLLLRFSDNTFAGKITSLLYPGKSDFALLKDIWMSLYDLLRQPLIPLHRTQIVKYLIHFG